MFPLLFRSPVLWGMSRSRISPLRFGFLLLLRTLLELCSHYIFSFLDMLPMHEIRRRICTLRLLPMLLWLLFRAYHLLEPRLRLLDRGLAFHVPFYADQGGVARRHAGRRHIHALGAQGMDKSEEIGCRRSVVAAARLQELDPAVADFDQAGGGDARAVQEGRVLEAAGLLDADVEVERGVGDEDPFAFGGGFAHESVEDRVGGDFGGFLVCFRGFVAGARGAGGVAGGIARWACGGVFGVGGDARLGGDDAHDGVFPFDARVDPDTVFLPAEPTMFVDRGQVVQPLFATQVADFHRVQSFAGTNLQTEFLAFALVQPVEEVLACASSLPFGVVFPQVTPVAMVHVHHLEEVG